MLCDFLSNQTTVREGLIKILQKFPARIIYSRQLIAPAYLPRKPTQICMHARARSAPEEINAPLLRSEIRQMIPTCTYHLCLQGLSNGTTQVIKNIEYHHNIILARAHSRPPRAVYHVAAGRPDKFRTPPGIRLRTFIKVSIAPLATSR